MTNILLRIKVGAFLSLLAMTWLGACDMRHLIPVELPASPDVENTSWPVLADGPTRARMEQVRSLLRQEQEQIDQLELLKQHSFEHRQQLMKIESHQVELKKAANSVR